MEKDEQNTFEQTDNIKFISVLATDNNPQKWQANKKEMLKIMKEAQISGAYQNQNQQEWNNFFDFYINFLNAQIGPRGDSAKKIRQELLEKFQIVDEILKPYNQTHKTHIRSIWVHYKFLTPCKEYHTYKIMKQTLQKCQQNHEKLCLQNGPMYLSIKDGLVNKHGKQYDFKAKIEQLKTNYMEKIENLSKKQVQLKQVLNQMPEYTNYVKVGDFMRPYFEEWIQADSGMGKDSVNRGQLFEQKVLKNVVPYIIKSQRQNTLSHIPQECFQSQYIEKSITQTKGNASKKHKIGKLHIMTNLRWVPKQLGQIDIAIVQYDQVQKEYTAHVLIECKARLFDIRQASMQVFSQNFQNQNKRQLSSKYGKVHLSKNLSCYIITSLPDFDFNLPIESKLKQTLDKVTKNLPIYNIKQQQLKQKLRKECVSKFKTLKSPLDWFIQNDSNQIIVLSGQTLQI